MARRLRLQYEGARYHVINRGNYRRDVFETTGATTAFEAVLADACERYGWRLHAHVIMRNHYHLALETPQPNLVEGMHWLQSTFATRFNRFRSERGHLFQGRYQALLVEDPAALVRVINYIHLNPVRAGIVPAQQVAAFRWSSLHRFLKGPRPPWLAATDLLQELHLEDTRDGWSRYLAGLIELACNLPEQGRQGFCELARGWAIGTEGWRRAVARDHAHLARTVGIATEELRDIKKAHWREALTRALRDVNKSQAEIDSDPQRSPWKIEIAARLRREVAAPYRWIALTLNLGNPDSIRAYVSRRQLQFSA